MKPGVELVAVDQALGETLGAAIAAIEPWSVINFPARHLVAFLTGEDPALRRMAAIIDGHPAGVAGVRMRWLRGPYLQLLAVLPEYQGQGLGAELLRWFEAQATEGDRWFWLCCSTFNTRAFSFYEAHGYQKVAVLPELLVDGSDEFLMRKRRV
jgi:diamine N-acetyltransferase